MLDHEEKTTLRELLRALVTLVHDLTKAVRKYLAETTSDHATSIQGDLPMNYQLNTLDSVVVTLTDTEDATGAAVTIDPGSVTTSLSDTGDNYVVNPDGTLTITGGTTLGTSKTITVNAKVGGVASTPWVGTYDVVAATPPVNATTLSGTFGTESGPTQSNVASGAQPATAPAGILLASGRTIQAGTPLPAGTTYNAATNELVNADGTAYLG